MKNLEATGLYHYSLSGDDSSFDISLDVLPMADGIETIKIKLSAEQPAVPPVLYLNWVVPDTDIIGIWHPETASRRGITTEWWLPEWKSYSASSAPVLSLFSASGQNRHTFAIADAMNVIKYHARICEETATLKCSITFFDTPTAPLSDYETEVRIDIRDIFYAQALRDVSDWWAAQPGYTPAAVPDVCKQPLYSSWYSYHQLFNAKELEEECKLAYDLGCRSVILDDGWQTDGFSHAYFSCGDWEASAEKLPDPAAHVKAINSIGLKYMFWYAVPFIGKDSKAWTRFKNKFLSVSHNRGAGLLDPRYPEVREYLINTYEAAVKKWGLNGFKLDFVDQFCQPKEENPQNDPGRDYASVPEAVDRLFSDIMTRLRALDPDIMIEFRQMYIGPLMRKYGNMFRAGDCGNDALTNKIRTIDIRLLAGNTAVHSDMLMWHPEDPAESAVLQLLYVLFSVPQISVRIEKLPQRQRKALSFWLDFWCQNREVLLGGELLPFHPEVLYPVVAARDQNTFIAAAYAPMVIPMEKSADNILLVNATRQAGLYLNAVVNLGEKTVTVQDCTGRVIDRYTLSLNGLRAFDVPASGLVTIE